MLAFCGLLALDAYADETSLKRPHVLMVVIDTLRADHLGCYGYDRETSPTIDRLAQQGVLFERCYATSSWTLPSFVSLLSGLYPTSHGADTWSSMMGENIPWLPEKMQRAGYHTIGVSSNPFLTRKQGVERGFDTFDDQTVLASAEWSFPLLESQHKAIVLASTASTATRRAMELLAERPEDKPVFMMVHYMDCHADYVPPAPWDTMFDPEYDGEVTGHLQSQNYGTDLEDRDVEHIESLYDGEIAHVDAHIGQLLQHLEAIEMADETLVVLTSDHGEELMDHGGWSHGHTLYEEVVRVPLIIVWPGQLRQSYRVSQAVSLVDVVPTLTEFLNLQGTPGHGINLTDYLVGNDVVHAERSIFMETNLSRPLRAVVMGFQKTIGELGGSKEKPLIDSAERYDLESDPAERVVHDGNRETDVELLQTAFTDLIEMISVQVQGESSTGAQMNANELERLRSLGYIGE